MRLHHALALLALASPAIVSCKAPSGYETQADTAASMYELHETIDDTRVQMMDAIENLRQIQRDAEVDPRPAFETYLDNVKKLEKSGDGLARAVRAIEHQGQDHFDAWEARIEQIQKESLRTRSLERRAVRRDDWLGLLERAQVYMDGYGSFVVDLRDVATYLESDLNATGIATVADEIGRIEGKVRAELERMHQLMDRLEASAETFGPLPSAKVEDEAADESDED
tara:strand:+ start:15871 stop:16548 length:678 start_codon:yes stop_codon:yes gene_type:complete